MKQIKFRAWDKSHNSMEYINDFYWFEESGVHDNEGQGHHGNYILMQYVGLKDKYDMEIYEGDIVQGKLRGYEWVIPQKVTFLNGCFMFGNWNAHEYFNKHTEITVLGNIYESPELLEELEDKN